MRWAGTPQTRAKLAAFLEVRGVTRGDVTTRPIGDGHSILTFLASDGSRQVVVRRPPPPPTPPGAHDMLREARLLGALAGTAGALPPPPPAPPDPQGKPDPFSVMDLAPRPLGAPRPPPAPAPPPPPPAPRPGARP